MPFKKRSVAIELRSRAEAEARKEAAQKAQYIFKESKLLASVASVAEIS